MVKLGKRFKLVPSLIRLPNFNVLAYLEVPKVAKPEPTDRQTDEIWQAYQELDQIKLEIVVFPI